VRIALLIEGNTEKAFVPCLRRFLEKRLAGKMPKLDPVPYNGRIPREERLKRDVERLLSDSRQPADVVIALTDVYTGSREFADGTDAMEKMRGWVGQNTKFYAHVAQYEFEAWLLPYWGVLQKLSDGSRNVPSGNPEAVNHNKPPSRWINELFKTGRKRKSYVKVRDAARVLRESDLLTAAQECNELKAFLNTILELCGGDKI
jgi:hypothetical protein